MQPGALLEHSGWLFHARSHFAFGSKHPKNLSGLQMRATLFFIWELQLVKKDDDAKNKRLTIVIINDFTLRSDVGENDLYNLG